MMDIHPVIVMLDDTFVCYNGVSNKANGAGSEPPHAALSHHEGVTIVTTSHYYTHSISKLNSPRSAVRCD